MDVRSAGGVHSADRRGGELSSSVFLVFPSSRPPPSVGVTCRSGADLLDFAPEFSYTALFRSAKDSASC